MIGEKLSLGFLTMSVTNWTVQLQKMARYMLFCLHFGFRNVKAFIGKIKVLINFAVG